MKLLLVAAVALIDADFRVLIAERPEGKQLAGMWEFPGGKVEPGETPEAALARELAEEAGLAARSWREAQRLDMSNSVTDEKAVAFLAWDLHPVPTAPDPAEAFRVARVPFLDLMDAVGLGAVRDAFTVATALRAHHMAVTSQLPGWLCHVMLGRPR